MANPPTSVAMPEAVHPPAIRIDDLWPWALFAGALLLFALFFVSTAQGALSIVPGNFLHELFHDGRHLLAYPCH
jgi:hypothetical protein